MWREGWDESANASPSVLDGAFGSFSKQCFELGEGLLDGIEVRAVRWQKEQLSACCADGLADSPFLMVAEIVDDDDGAWRGDVRPILFAGAQTFSMLMPSSSNKGPDHIVALPGCRELSARQGALEVSRLAAQPADPATNHVRQQRA